jgi:hypothetical protein
MGGNSLAPAISAGWKCTALSAGPHSGICSGSPSCFQLIPIKKPQGLTIPAAWPADPMLYLRLESICMVFLTSEMIYSEMIYNR